MHRQPPYIAPLLLLLFSLLLGAPPALASGELSGTVTYGLASYRAAVDGVEQTRADSMSQQYALRYATRGLLGDARAGRYTLMLGYEFNVLDVSLADDGRTRESRVTTNKPFYEGSFVLAPGGLPFRLTGYVRDLHRTAFIEGGSFSGALLGTQPSGGGASLLAPNVVVELQNGTHREIGSTLVVGIRNGSYLGLYRDVLSRLPRLLVDYRQIDVRDLASLTRKSHYRGRDLAFISLNKKDNWVHFRTHDYVDFLDGRNNSTSHQLLLGTVDQGMERQWINLTNWIKLSGDLSYNRSKSASEPVPEEGYNLNLQAVGRRATSQMAILSSFARTTRGEVLRESGSIPLYADFVVGRNTSYHLSYSVSAARNHYLDDGITPEAEKESFDQSNSSQNLYVGAELFRTGAIVFSPHASVESRNEEDSRGLALQLGLEWRNRVAELLHWKAGYELTSNQTSSASGDSSAYLQNRLSASAEKSFSRALRAGVNGSFLYGSGRQGTVFFMTPTAPTDQSGTATLESSIMSYSILGFVEHSGPRCSNRLQVSTATTVLDKVDSSTTASVQHVLSAETSERTFNLTSQIVSGEGGGRSRFDYLRPETGNGGLTGSTPDFGWSSSARYVLTPNRELQLQLTGELSGTVGGEVDTPDRRGTERLSYTFFTVNGIIRKFAELSEEFGYEALSAGVDDRKAALFLRLSGSIYPTKYFYGRLATEFVEFMPKGAIQHRVAGETGLNFEKMQVALSYATAAKDAEKSAGLAAVVERRWDLKVKKVF